MVSGPETEQGAVNAGRRRFLRGDYAASSTAALRPPGALPELRFIAACTRCDACVRVCPTGIVRRGSAGFPEVTFTSGECTFCGECVAACTPGALRGKEVAWNLKASIAKSCLVRQKVLCRSCADACDTRAIGFQLAPGGGAMHRLSLDACNGCGACVRACPVSAIVVQPEQPDLAAARQLTL